jgi:hypothetical protein
MVVPKLVKSGYSLPFCSLTLLKVTFGKHALAYDLNVLSGLLTIFNHFGNTHTRDFLTTKTALFVCFQFCRVGLFLKMQSFRSSRVLISFVLRLLQNLSIDIITSTVAMLLFCRSKSSFAASQNISKG